MAPLTSNLKTYWFGLYNEEEGPVERGDPHYGYEAREEFVSIRDYERLRAALLTIATGGAKYPLGYAAQTLYGEGDSSAPETKTPQLIPVEVERLIEWHRMAAGVTEQTDDFVGARMHRERLRVWQAHWQAQTGSPVETSGKLLKETTK